MKYTQFFILLLLFACNKIEPSTKSAVLEKGKKEPTLQAGDIIFQSTNSSQCKAVKLATHSPFSHCGLIYPKGNEWFVYEAVQPVKITPFEEWIGHGEGHHYVVNRLKDRDKILSPEALKKMEEVAISYVGKNYDLYFEWSDDKIYCSELVWKVYKEGANVEVGNLQKLATFDLSSPIVKAKLAERYGENVPLEEMVISPGGIFESKNLDLIIEK